MLHNYFKIAFRNILRNKVYSFINIFGLTLGIACFMLILLWVKDEITFNDYHKNIDRIFRVMEFQHYADRIGTTQSTPGTLGPYLKETYAEVEYVTRFTWEQETLFEVEENRFYETARYVDPDFLRIFSFDIVAGSFETALDDKYSVVISDELARKYFGEEDAVGQLIKVRNSQNVKVTGVFRPWPDNTTFGGFHALLSVVDYVERNTWANKWGNNNLRTVITLHDPENYQSFDGKIKNIIREKMEDEDYDIDLWLQPYTETHLYSNFENGQQKGGRITYIKIFSIIAAFILIVACINFMNLATAQAVTRAKEVGLRKVVGAYKKNLIVQFLSESFLYAAISCALAMGLSWLLMPYFNEVTEKEIVFQPDQFLGLVILGVVVFTGFFSGSYPAFFITRYQPAAVLKGIVRTGLGAIRFRKVLVVFQFILSIVIIFGTLVIYRQLQYLRSQDTGYDKTGLIYMEINQDMDEKYDVIKTRLLSNPAIENVAAMAFSPLRIGNSTWGVDWPGKDPETKILFSTFGVDNTYVETLGLEMAAGRSFEARFVTDTSNYMINETAAEKMGFTPEEAVDKTITLWGDRVGKIVGVMKNFNFSSSRTEIRPMLLMHDPGWYSYITVRANGLQLQSAIAAMEEVSNEFAPAYPFEYHFVDEDWASFYSNEDRMGKLFNGFAFISIVIACLGLFGLSAFTIQQRTKEIGVRKVLGASVSSIVKLTSRDFSLLVLIAAILGTPVAWYLMNKWLEDFAFRIEMTALFPAISTVVVLLIAFLTVFYHAYKAARSNPAESLHYE